VVIGLFTAVSMLGALAKLLAVSTVTVSGALVAMAVFDVWIGFPFLKSANPRFRIPAQILVAVGFASMVVPFNLSPPAIQF